MKVSTQSKLIARNFSKAVLCKEKWTVLAPGTIYIQRKESIIDTLISVETAFKHSAGKIFDTSILIYLCLNSSLLSPVTAE